MSGSQENVFLSSKNGKSKLRQIDEGRGRPTYAYDIHASYEYEFDNDKTTHKSTASAHTHTHTCERAIPPTHTACVREKKRESVAFVACKLARIRDGDGIMEGRKEGRKLSE